MLCLSGFELYSRWVPLNFISTSMLSYASHLLDLLAAAAAAAYLINFE